MRTRQRNLGKCKCGRPILTGHLRQYNGDNTKLCPACNAEAIIEGITHRARHNEGLDSTDSDRYDTQHSLPHSTTSGYRGDEE